jgi:hypothetical protein
MANGRIHLMRLRCSTTLLQRPPETDRARGTTQGRAWRRCIAAMIGKQSAGTVYSASDP